jgi:predicted nucleic acid-binding protein
MKVVDTNVFIRYLTGDHRQHSQAALGFFKRLEAGHERATTLEAILAETIYVLSSPRLYHLAPSDIEARLRPLLLLRGFHIPHQRRYLRALTLYATLGWASFEDALILAQLEDDGLDTVVSFDRGFDRAPGVNREEPAVFTED